MQWETRGDVVHSTETWETIDSLWRVGSLEHLLDETQLEIYRFIRASPSSTDYVDAARQLGKSFVCVVIALEDAIRNPGKRVNYIAKTFGSLKKMIEQTMALIVIQAPPEVRPVFVVSDSRWEFPLDGPAKGAFIQLVGADETRGADTARGGSVVTNIVDEAGFIACLEYLLNSVIKPMGRRTGAKTILSTSPAPTPDHYSCEIEDICAANGSLIVRDYWAPGMQSHAEKVKFLEAEAKALNLSVDAFMRTTTFRREYMCERVIDSTLAVVPEFLAVRDDIVVARDRPDYFDIYASMDPGADDLTGVLVGYSDFQRAKLVITHELLLAKANTGTVAREFLAIMHDAYGSEIMLDKGMPMLSPQGPRPYAFVIDDPHKHHCNDLWNYHRISASPAMKDDSEAAVNVMRVQIGARVVEIHPRCANLVRQLSSAVRVKPGGDWTRSKRDGHWDLVAALKYMIRHYEPGRNPFPVDYGFNRTTQVRRVAPDRPKLADMMLKGTSLARRR